MRIFKTLLLTVFLCFIMAGFSQCSGTKHTQEPQLEKTAPIPVEKAYFQAWVAGIQGGGSGIHLYLPDSTTDIKLDSVYFREMVAKLNRDSTGYVALFRTQTNQRDDVIMSNENHAEYGNTLSEKAQIPFQLKANECVVSYIENNNIRYFKIENLIEKPMKQYPSAPPRR